MHTTVEKSGSSSPASSNSGGEEGSFRRSQEATSKRFDRTSNGKIYSKNLNEIFSMLLIDLKLSVNSHSHLEKNVFKIFRNKSFPYSFTIEDAVGHMKDLELKVNLLTTCTTFSYSVKPELAVSLLRKFMRAKWLHCPADRTRYEPKSGVVLQPTPKGCAILQNFCLRVGLKKNDLPLILTSNFNSMGLITFERDPKTDHIIQSEYLIYLLFVRFLCPEPNIWSSTNDPDPIPKSYVNTDECNFLQNFDSGIGNPFSEWDHKNSIESPKVTKSPKIQESPFHHRFFTNPDSDAHVQYYVSNKGIRFLKPREFGNPSIKISHFFSGKAAVQWFMDCTDCLYPLEAAEIVHLLIKHGLVEPITLQPSRSPKVGFKAASDCSYTLTSKGYSIVKWDEFKSDNVKLQNESTGTATSPAVIGIPEKFSLQDVLEDPGSRFLFRQHLKLEHCEENLDAYVEISDFFKLMTVLKKIIKLNNHQKKKEFDLSQSSSSETAKFNEMKNSRNQAALELANDCLSKSYSIYSSFLSNGSPYAINISDNWREEAQSILVHPNSPLMDSFPKTPLTPVTIAIDEFNNDIAEVPNEETTANNNSKNLSIDLVVEGANDGRVFLLLTPSTQSMSSALNVLERIDHVLKKINQHIFFLLSQDSFPKFLNSEVFQKNTNQIKLSRSQSD